MPSPKPARSGLVAAGIVGTWEWDHNKKVARYCESAAELLAGNASLAGRDLSMSEALAGVYTDDVAWLRSQMRQAVSGSDVRIREHRVCSEQHGVRRVLCRGRTYFDVQGARPSRWVIVIDITEVEADGRRRHADGRTSSMRRQSTVSPLTRPFRRRDRRPYRASASSAAGNWREIARGLTRGGSPCIDGP